MCHCEALCAEAISKREYFLLTLSPFIPLPLHKGKGVVIDEGASPLFDSSLVIPSKERRSGV